MDKKTQKVQQSLQTIMVSARHNNTNQNNEGKKHDSYMRYLNKKKGNVFYKCKCNE